MTRFLFLFFLVESSRRSLRSPLNNNERSVSLTSSLVKAERNQLKRWARIWGPATPCFYDDKYRPEAHNKTHPTKRRGSFFVFFFPSVGSVQNRGCDVIGRRKRYFSRSSKTIDREQSGVPHRQYHPSSHIFLSFFFFIPDSVFLIDFSKALVLATLHESV